MNKVNGTFKRPVFQSGFTLIELIISLGIGLFLLTGIAVIFLSNRATFITQGYLAQLQNNEISAMNIINNVVQSAGYYIDPLHQSSKQANPQKQINSPIETTYLEDQVVFGGSFNGSDVLAVRAYHNTSTPGIIEGAIDCTGNAGSLADGTGQDQISSTFSVDSSGNLQCTTWDLNKSPPKETAANQLLIGKVWLYVK